MPFPGKTRTSCAGKIGLFIVFFLVGQVAAAPGENCLRVSKNGVIYYYFSDRWSANSDKTPVYGQRNRIYRSQTGYKLPAHQVDPLVKEVSRYYNLPPSLVKAIIRVESNFNPGATSPKGAQGLMQLMPGTADSLAVANPYDVRENVWAGTRYLKLLLDKFNNHLPMALAAYNAGPQRVEKHRDIPPIPETRGFVRDVCANFLKYSRE